MESFGRRLWRSLEPILLTQQSLRRWRTKFQLQCGKGKDNSMKRFASLKMQNYLEELSSVTFLVGHGKQVLIIMGKQLESAEIKMKKREGRNSQNISEGEGRE